jgi:hypothetical protein
MKNYIFISYSQRDRADAEAVRAALEGDAIRCWIAPRDVGSASTWAESILGGIRGARALVLILSGAANSSQHVLREVERAADAGLAILPYRVEDCRPTGGLEYFLSPIHWLDAWGRPSAEPLAELVATVRRLLPADAVSAAGVRLSLSRNDGTGRYIAQVPVSPPTPARALRDMKPVAPAPAKVSFVTGDRLRVEVEVDRPGFLVVFNIGPTGRLNPLYPTATTAPPAPVVAGDRLPILDVELIPPVGHERLVAVWSPTPLHVPLEELRRLAEPESVRATRDMAPVAPPAHILRPEDCRVAVVDIDHCPAPDSPGPL